MAIHDLHLLGVPSVFSRHSEPDIMDNLPPRPCIGDSHYVQPIAPPRKAEEHDFTASPASFSYIRKRSAPLLCIQCRLEKKSSFITYRNQSVVNGSHITSPQRLRDRRVSVSLQQRLLRARNDQWLADPRAGEEGRTCVCGIKVELL